MATFDTRNKLYDMFQPYQLQPWRCVRSHRLESGHKICNLVEAIAIFFNPFSMA